MNRERYSGGVRAVVVAMAAAGVFSGVACGQAFYLTGLAPGTEGGRTYGLSADGTIAAGWSSRANFTPGYVWTADTGRYDFGLEPGLPSLTITAGLSGDGRAVVGTAGDLNQRRAFRWSGPGTYQTLGSFGYPATYAQAVNHDGSIIVGRGEFGTGGFIGQAFRWTSATGMVGLGFTRPGHGFSEAAAISRDGSTIVGTSRGGSDYRAFTWTQGTGMLELPGLPGTTNVALGVSADGAYVVGASGDGFLPVVWQAGQLRQLELSGPYFTGAANCVNDAGDVIGGYVAGPPGQTQYAAVWTPEWGMELLSDYLAFHGVQVPAGLTLTTCSAISADGMTFAGWTERPNGGLEGYVAVIPCPASVALLFPLLLSSLNRRRIAP
ncbi:MAG: hypothetical protein SFY69_12435 [Planctomycetota bacterium]|nr:hypothetical protein [Planctomycetota bacterium]